MFLPDKYSHHLIEKAALDATLTFEQEVVSGLRGRMGFLGGPPCKHLVCYDMDKINYLKIARFSCPLVIQGFSNFCWVVSSGGNSNIF